MTRTEYLTQLELYLKKLPEADRMEAMDYFRELFDDAGVEGEEELIASLGTPKEAAHEVLSNLLDKKSMRHPLKRITDKFAYRLVSSPCSTHRYSSGNRHPRVPVRNLCGSLDCHSSFLCGFHTWYHRRIPIFS